jgi:hypothetical protein
MASATRAKFGFLNPTPKGAKPAGFLLLDVNEGERLLLSSALLMEPSGWNGLPWSTTTFGPHWSG